MYNRRTFLRLSAGLLAAPAVLAVANCSQISKVGSQDVQENLVAPSPPRDTLRVAMSGTPKHFDPALFSVNEEYQLGFAIFDGLVWVDETLTAQPMLAETWESTKDMLKWTFKLREDVSFHHETPLSAADVVYTFSRILDPKTGSIFRNTLSFIDSVEAIDDYTVQFLLKSPSAELPVLLGAPQARIVAKDYDSKVLDETPSGTGPFRFVNNLPGALVQLERNPTYWQPDRPQLASLEFIFIPYTQQISAIKNATVDVLMQIGMADIVNLESDPAVSVMQSAGGGYQSIVLRATTAPFRDVRVREALKYCMDRQTFQRDTLKRRGEMGNDHPVAPISTFYADFPLRSYDPDQARSLLSAAGYNKGLKLDLLTSTVRPGMIELATAFKQMAKPAGIDIEVIHTPPQVYWSDYAGRVPFHVGNWGFRPSIDETFMVAYHSLSKGNESHWYNATLDTLIDQARGEANVEERHSLYYQAQQLLSEQGGVIIPYFLPTVMATRADVQGFITHPSGWLDFRTTYFG